MSSSLFYQQIKHPQMKWKTKLNFVVLLFFEVKMWYKTNQDETEPWKKNINFHQNIFVQMGDENSKNVSVKFVICRG